MGPKSPDDRPEAPAQQPQPLEWRFAQVFGERVAGEEVQEVDIISAIEFDKSGDHLATGDRGGRVFLFERSDARDNSSRRELERQDYPIASHHEFRYKTEFQSHEPEVDELEKTISVASRDLAYYGLDEVELSRRWNWTGSAHNQMKHTKSRSSCETADKVGRP